MKTSFRSLLLATSLTPLSWLVAADVPVGSFDGQADIGAPKKAGSASYDPASQEYTVTGGGTDMWATTDQFHTAWKKWTGDFILRARVEFAGKRGADHRKMGWIVRSSLDADAPYASAAEHGDGLTSLVFRRTKGAVTEQIKSDLTNADVIQLERRGNKYTFSAAKFGEPFGKPCELDDLDLGADVYVGLFVCSHNADATEKAVFRDVRLIKPMKLNFRAYSEFIGSDLQILDLTTMKIEELYSSRVPFEAPNWTHDGAALIYNVSGRQAGWGSLQCFDLKTRTPTLIEMAFADRANNNDHVLSFDGTMLGISNQSSTSPRSQSAVYTVPVTGGTPKLITPNVPSYFHGWSPDGKFLIFAGGRRAPGETVEKPS
jgi:TolB protein